MCGKVGQQQFKTSIKRTGECVRNPLECCTKITTLTVFRCHRRPREGCTLQKCADIETRSAKVLGRLCMSAIIESIFRL